MVTAAIGVVVLVKMFRRPSHRLSRTILSGAVLSVAFILVLTPWTIRNWRTLHVFEPLAPPNGNMPDEFVPLGYESWLKTWMTDGELLDDFLWNLDEGPIDSDELPDTAFDSEAEHDRVVALFDQYNKEDSGDSEAKPASSPSPSPGNNDAKKQGSDEEDNDEQSDERDNDTANDESAKKPDLTPELDAAFGQIAKERIARHPFRYYVLLPLRRAHALWFNTHSDFYPFVGNALPLLSPENNRAENFWLPIFAVLVGIYTVLGVGGLVLLTMNGGFAERVWVLLVALIFIARLVLFSNGVSVEPRYVVEFFPFLAAAGAIALLNFKDWFKQNKPSDA